MLFVTVTTVVKHRSPFILIQAGANDTVLEWVEAIYQTHVVFSICPFYIREIYLAWGLFLELTHIATLVLLLALLQTLW